MHPAGELLTALAVVLGVAAVTTIAFRLLHQPVVLGYVLAGLIIGPHVPVPLVAEPAVVHTLSELGVILLMFGLGLEFTLGKLVRAAPSAGLTALLQCSLMVWLGYVTGRLLGWTPLESVYTGALIAISSTTIIARAFDEQAVGGRLRELVVSILIIEDLIAVLLMAILIAASGDRGLSAGELATTVARLTGFLVALVVIGLLVVPRVVRAVAALDRPETTVVTAIAICFGVALLAQELGYSVALGAFVAGVLVAESGEVHRIEPLVHPIRDLFAAVFFVSVGMMIDPADVADHALAIAVLTAVVIAGKVVGVTVGAFLTGNGTRTSIAAGMSLAQIGEFSFIIASLGVSLGAIGDHVYPVAVAVSAITTLTTPWLIRRGDRAADLVDRSLPRPLQTFTGLYESWIERLRAPRAPRTGARRLAMVLLVDVVVVSGVIITVSLTFDWLAGALALRLGLAPTWARIAVAAGGGALALPFCLGILRTGARLGRALADAALPPPPAGTLDLAQAPRAVLAATVRLGGVAIAGLPLVALTQPFLPGLAAAAMLGLALLVLAIALWRTTRDLQGHVRSAALVIVEALAARTAATAGEGAGAEPPADPLAEARRLLPGLGEPERVELAAGSPAVGRTLAELALRSVTGATVLVVIRAGEGTALPDAHTPLAAGDVLAIAGAADAIALARAHLLGDGDQDRATAGATTSR